MNINYSWVYPESVFMTKYHSYSNSVDSLLQIKTSVIDDRGRKGGGGTLCTPSKKLKKFGHKNAIKHENTGPPRFFSELKNSI
jgi:hypothetical protein